MASGTFTAVVDRIEGDLAVLLLEEDGEPVEQLDVDERRLPEEGRHEGAVFEVELADGDLVGVDYLPDVTAERRRSAQERFDRLSRDLGESRDASSDDGRESRESRENRGSRENDRENGNG